MTRKSYTTINILGILCLVLCGAGSFYHLVLSSPATSPHMRHKALPTFSSHTLPGNNFKAAPLSSIQHHLARFIDLYPFTALVGAVVLLGIGLGCLAYLILPTQTRSEAPGVHRGRRPLQEKTLNSNVLPPQDIAESSKPTLDDTQYTARNMAYHEQNAHRRTLIRQGATPDISPSTASKSLTTSMQQPNTPRQTDKVGSEPKLLLPEPPSKAKLAHPRTQKDSLFYRLHTAFDPEKEVVALEKLPLPASIQQHNHKTHIDTAPLKHTSTLLQKMMKGKTYSDVTKRDIHTFKKLFTLSGTHSSWKACRLAQRKLTINIWDIYHHYALFIPLLCPDKPKVKNLLQFDQISQIFPNVTQIVCTAADYDGDRGVYTAAIVDKHFIAGMKNQLKQSLQSQLTEIVIQTSFHKIEAYLSIGQEKGWSLGQGAYTLVATKTPYTHFIAKMSAMIHAAPPSSEVTSLERTMCRKLVNNLQTLSADNRPVTPYIKAVPAKTQKKWTKFRQGQQRIHIDMYRMYADYSCFKRLLFTADPASQNLLSVEKVLQIFPNATQIVCVNIDCIGTGNYDYSKHIVNSNFIARLKEMLEKIAQNKQHQLARIVLATFKHKIKDSCNLQENLFNARGWHIQKENQRWHDSRGTGVQGTISLTKIEKAKKKGGLGKFRKIKRSLSYFKH